VKQIDDWRRMLEHALRQSGTREVPVAVDAEHVK
jgi:16S rRNA U1498 N3-methylase RsmE